MPRKKSKFGRMEYRSVSIIKPLADRAEEAIRKHPQLQLQYRNLPDLVMALIREWLKDKGYLR